VAFGAGKALRAMFRMAKVHLKSSSSSWSTNGPSGLVANTAGAYIAAAYLVSRAVALKARQMRRKTRRDRQGDARADRFVTCCTSRLPNVAAVIEKDIKAADRRKSLHACFGMTDIADRALIALGKLLSVARRTGNMSGHRRRRSIIRTHVANETRHSAVLLCIVSESRKVLKRRFINCRFVFRAGLESICRIAVHQNRRSKKQYRGRQKQ